MTDEPSKPERAAELEDLRTRLAEAEEVLHAIRNGEVDAVLVSGERGEQVYTLSGADRVYRQLIETMSEGAMTLSADGVILYCNVRLTEMLGRPLDQVLGTALRNYLPPADQQTLGAILAQARTELSRREINLKSSEGRLAPVYLSASRLHSEGAEMVFCLVLTDLTEQKHHEQIVAVERLARLILEQVAEAIVVCDEQGRIIRASQAAQRFCDGNPLLRPFAEVFPLRTDASDPFHLAPVLQGETLRNVDVTLDRQGQELDLILNAGPILSDQQILGCVVTLTDITKRKQAEEDLQKSHLELQETLQKSQDLQKQMIISARMNALGQMSSGIAHDFNNALTPILGYSDLLLSKPDILDNREETVEMLKQLRAGAMNAADTVRRLREFYRPSDLSQQKPVDLSECIQNTVAFTQPKWKEEMAATGIAIDIRTEIESVPPVTGNQHELNQLLTNLIFNAVEAMPKGGSITIRLHPNISRKHALIVVQDTGIGMSEEVRCRCFDPFFTTKNGRGVGLGLSLVYGIIQRHNGNIEVQSELGKGTTFIVQLPLKEPQLAQPQEKEEPPPDLLPPVSCLRILLVDDEKPVRLVIGRCLEADGHTVELAADGRKGLTSFQTGHFDLVILDRAMPGMSGDELAAAIKVISPETPVIMLTGFDNIIQEQDEQPVGVDMIMSKPVTRQDLSRATAKIMAKKRKTS